MLTPGDKSRNKSVALPELYIMQVYPLLRHPDRLQHACKMELRNCLEATGIALPVWAFWLKFKNPDAPAVRWEAGEDDD